MENFNKIFIPKIDKEEENLKPESDDKNKENKIEEEPPVVVIEIDGIRMEGEKRHFDYPEQIQKEKGILGYDRTIISNENLNKFIKDYCHGVYGFDIEKYGFTDLESFLKIEKETSDAMLKTWSDIEKNYPSYSKKEEQEIAKKNYHESSEYYEASCISEIEEKLQKKILYKMSDGNYPNKTFNHIISAYSRNRNAYLDNFVKDKFFVQEIYNIDLIKKLSEDGAKNIFSSDGNMEAGNTRLTICKKQTNEIVGLADSMTFDSLAKSEFIDNLKNGECFAYTDGLNFSVGRFFQNFGRGKRGASPSFGFKLENNDFLSKYLNKILINKIKEISPKNKVDISELLVDILYMNESIQRILTEKKDNEESFRSNENKKELLKVEVEKIINQIEKENNIKIKTYINDEYIYTPKDADGFARSINWSCDKDEVYMPVYIGHDDILQLCWGHADYGHFINSSGLNFFEFYHDESVLEKDA